MSAALVMAISSLNGHQRHLYEKYQLKWQSKRKASSAGRISGIVIIIVISAMQCGGVA
jgi:hypothetical protein